MTQTRKAEVYLYAVENEAGLDDETLEWLCDLAEANHEDPETLIDTIIDFRQNIMS